ncbi:MAG TPA: ABC transporter permease [Bryobacteraceae bacterium]|nr:ABC transporter permease [Bryobacteraceae bacterium]
MEWLDELWRRLLFPFRRRQFDRDLEEEMQFHLDMKAREIGPVAARRKFGNSTLLQEDSREVWGWTVAEAWLDDLRYAARVLRKNPGFTAVVVLTLALGIGASTAVFSVVHAVLLRPLPFREPNRLAMVWETWEKRGDDRVVVSYDNFRDWKEQSQSFEYMAVFVGDSARMTVGDEPVEIQASRVSGGFFPALGIQPMLGRTFVPEEERMSAPLVTVLSYGLWQRLGGDPNLAGKTVRFDREVFTVVGIMPRGFAFPLDSELWFPFASDDNRNTRGTHYLRVIGRLKPGVTAVQAQSEMQTIAGRLKQEHPKENGGIGANVVPLMDQIVGEVRHALLALMGAVACVLLIACANVANLLLVRATGRRREIALRLALGASRSRVVRCLLTESVVLSLAGGALGVAAAYWLVRAFVAFDPIQLPRVHDVVVDGWVLLYALAAAITTGVVFGIVPALRASKPDLGSGLKEGPGVRGAGEFRKSRGRNALAAAQIALALVLVVGASLLLRSFVMRVSVPLGFQPEGVLAVELPWSAHRRVDELLERFRALPGVLAAGAATAFPQNSAGTSCDACVDIEDEPKREGKQYDTGLMVATPDFLRAAGMRLRQGRFFARGDGAEAPKVVVINEALVRRDFPGQDPIGRHIRWSGGAWSTIIGVAGNVKGFGVAGDPMPSVYFPHQQADWGNGVQVLIRTSVPPLRLVGSVRAEIRSWNRRIVIGKLDTLDNMLESSVAVPRFYLMLVAGFAVLAMMVSAVGVYGTINYSVARRTHEIGIRMALGAEPGDVLVMVLGQGLAITAAGVVIGLAGAWMSTRVLETLLFGIRPSDGVAFACGSGVLSVTVLLASLIPARRATRVDPLKALRCE